MLIVNDYAAEARDAYPADTKEDVRRLWAALVKVMDDGSFIIRTGTEESAALRRLLCMMQDGINGRPMAPKDLALADGADKLRVAGDLITEVLPTLDLGGDICLCCENVRYRRWDHRQAHQRLADLPEKLRRLAGSETLWRALPEPAPHEEAADNV